jgi:multimeric flavodoxin WrbA
MTNLKTIVIFGSSRSNGDTLDAIKMVTKGKDVPIIDLNKYDITYYDYENKNRDDDFLRLMEQIVEYDQIIFATPVYWYTMSAIMKTFFDRISDVLTIRKPLGRALANKNIFVITSYAVDMPKGFEDAFSQTAEYMDMHYKGCFYYYMGKDKEKVAQNEAEAIKFAKLIFG